MTFCFQSRVVINGVVTIKSGARLFYHRALKRDSADLSVVKDNAGRPYIPASALVKTLRNFAQEVTHSYGVLSTCNPYDDESGCIRLGQGKNPNGIYLKNLLDENIWSDDQLREAIERYTCMPCVLFGSRLIEPKIVMEDLRPERWAESVRSSDSSQELLDLITVDRKFQFKAVLDDCDLWLRGLFLCAAARAQNKLLTISSGAGRTLAIATFELGEIRALESPREYLEAVNSQSVSDGHLVDPSNWEAWKSAFNARLRELYPSHLAI